MTSTNTAVPTARKISTLGLAIAFGGAVVQLLLGIYYLSMAHAPQPHSLPIGIVASAEQRAQIEPRLEAGDQFKVEAYRDANSLIAAIKKRDAYGGAVLDGDNHTLYVASAASPAVANILKAAYNSAHGDQVAATVEALAKQGRSVDIATVQRVAAPSTIVDVVPLPKDDSNGGSLGFIIQALTLGGSIASVALGRLGKLTERSMGRGVRHAAVLVLYAALSAGVALAAMSIFGVGDGAATWALFGGLSLASLAITASVAGVVALVGPAGTLLGGLYFSLGIIISGASIAPELLPDGGRLAGQLLPPGAGATVVRDSLYFPDATTVGAFVVLGCFAGAGLLVVLLTNALDYRRPFERRQESRPA
ncbi:ABC transporter permease [Nocardioides jejuensis]|uniref:ABC transporter permease n=1 Tax=Nocardioides jejuensis TaxID=2502782 RepID=A0A4R1CKC7_9ACTN|nr:ABC transporter permease [Nocardioides jejuensis]TCJ30646.1 ABC transporter permease [Nocardioides jejuensis]